MTLNQYPLFHTLFAALVRNAEAGGTQEECLQAVAEMQIPANYTEHLIDVEAALGVWCRSVGAGIHLTELYAVGLELQAHEPDEPGFMAYRGHKLPEIVLAAVDDLYVEGE